MLGNVELTHLKPPPGDILSEDVSNFPGTIQSASSLHFGASGLALLVAQFTGIRPADFHILDK
jgi:hypothetical protein